MEAKPLTTDGDDWLEGVLGADAAEHAAEYLADEGFTSRVLERLPPPVALPAWRRPVVVLLWTIVAGAVAAALPGLAYDAFRNLVATLVTQPLTPSAIAVALLLLGATAWTAVVYAMRAE
jgi:hypothetical protein